jgi:hypothetical protein
VALVAYVERAQLNALLHRKPTPITTVTNTPSLVLPAFSDWRVAYVGQGGGLHAVSLDGKTDVTGIGLPALTATNASGTPVTGATLGAESASPDGRYLAYDGSSGSVLVHLTAHQGAQDAIRNSSAVPRAALWSPDSARMAWLGANGAIHLTTSDSLTDATVAGTSGQGIQEILGWVDATHLGVRVAKPNATSETVAALDIATGQQRVIVTLTKAGYGVFHYRLSPDGARLLAWNSAISGQSFTAIFRNYDTKTGAVHKLPNSLKAVGPNISAVAWKPGAASVAIASGANETHDLKLWLVDAAGDTASSLGTAYPLGWLTDGSQLIMSSANASKLGGGPYTISAVSFPATGAPVRVTLTDKAMSFPWLGLVRTG